MHSGLHSHINGLPTRFRSLEIPQIHLTELKISAEFPSALSVERRDQVKVKLCMSGPTKGEIFG